MLYPHYSISFDHLTIVNEDMIDKEFDNNIYQKNLFQPTSYLNAGYGTLYEHIGTVYQNVHTHYLIVGMKIPTHKDIPVPPQNATRTCFFEYNFKFTDWRSRAYRQCHFFNGLFNQTLLEGSHCCVVAMSFQLSKPTIKVYKLKPLQAFINTLWGVLDIQQPPMLF